jgi:hypothetical protein
MPQRGNLIIRRDNSSTTSTSEIISGSFSDL